MSLTGSGEGEKGSALLMWNVQTIQSTGVWAGAGWQPFKKTCRYDALPCVSEGKHRLIHAVTGFFILP